MDDSKKTKEELQKELEALRQQVVDLEVLQKKRNQNNETRRHSENHFHEALKNSPIVVFNQDRELRYTWIYNPNPGFSAQEVLGKTDSELISPEDSKQLVEIKQQVLESGVGTKKEVSTTIDGKPYYYDLNVEPLRN